MSKNFEDHIIEAKGHVKKILIDNTTGEVVDVLEDKNLIVKTGRTEMIKLIAGDSNQKITKMSVGKGGTADLTTNAFNPVPPVDGDTALRDQVYIATISGKTVTATGTNPKVDFTALFNCTDVNSLINECGLLFADGTTLFSRHTFDTVSLKSTTNFSLQIIWTIEF